MPSRVAAHNPRYFRSHSSALISSQYLLLSEIILFTYMVTVFLSQLEYKLREQDFLLFIRVAPRTVLGTQLELSIH